MMKVLQNYIQKYEFGQSHQRQKQTSTRENCQTVQKQNKRYIWKI